MYKPYFHPSLILSNSMISISFDCGSRFNKTKDCILISGNRDGFISLANSINVYSVNLSPEIPISKFSFVKSSIQLKIVEVNNNFNYGRVVKLEGKGDQFIWETSEEGIFRIFSLIHSLGYANNELHLDEGLEDSDISVYCVLD